MPFIIFHFSKTVKDHLGQTVKDHPILYTLRGLDERIAPCRAFVGFCALRACSEERGLFESAACLFRAADKHNLNH
jgi:hypothetical protein